MSNNKTRHPSARTMADIAQAKHAVEQAAIAEQVKIDQDSALAPVAPPAGAPEPETVRDAEVIAAEAEYVVKDQDKADAFKRLAGKRVSVILDKLDILQNCANRGQYEYSPAQVEKIRSAIQTKLDFVMNSYAPKAKAIGKTFEL